MARFGRAASMSVLTLNLVAFVLGPVFCAVPADEIKTLPGIHKMPEFKQYSGYLKATKNRMLHYWFVESQGSAHSDPVVLWLNGGPGCSSMDGLLTEHGPLLVQPDSTLKENPYSWNKYTNMLYLEAPAGVGYSFSADKNYTTDDDQVSLDNFEALKYFFSQYPELKNNEFFITGESYGGIYVPTLSVRVADSGLFNFKGFAVGNGLSNNKLNTDSLIYFGYFHGLWGNSLWKSLVRDCCKDGNDDPEFCDFSGEMSTACQADLAEASQVIGHLNIYNMYAQCYHGNEAHDNTTYVFTPEILLSHVPWLFRNIENLKKKTEGHQVALVPPCINATALSSYMNSAEVRKAIHIPDHLPHWEICSAEVGMYYKRIYSEMTSQYQHILKSQKYRILVYNGDVDMACNFLMDEWFTASLKQTLLKPSSSWMYTAADGSSQVAGYHTLYQNLWFTTIRGAGHMVPTNRPIPSLLMFKAFLDNKSFN